MGQQSCQLNRPPLRLEHHRINFLTKKVGNIRLRIYICPLIDSMVELARVKEVKYPKFVWNIGYFVL
jgi:hypothetical protein